MDCEEVGNGHTMGQQAVKTATILHRPGLYAYISFASSIK